ncbi:UrcA family protein [Brevundimonas lenta]|uniref:UrcA family protein n=1 Tax=Brevundimonas lenta TaxID=424796 RepID=A0A7W6JA06_9CAUL|nr:UrcA family protein [Brevundimonas lenta]MBB4081284.1 UrcA family protein [Brevundimonas lenta]
MLRTLASLTAVTLLSAGSAAAQDVRVSYGDLDLASYSGTVAFDARVAKGVRDACRHGPRLVDTLCVMKVQREAVGLLPAARQEDYARARRDERLVVRAPTIPN